MEVASGLIPKSSSSLLKAHKSALHSFQHLGLPNSHQNGQLSSVYSSLGFPKSATSNSSKFCSETSFKVLWTTQSCLQKQQHHFRDQFSALVTLFFCYYYNQMSGLKQFKKEVLIWLRVWDDVGSSLFPKKSLTDEFPALSQSLQWMESCQFLQSVTFWIVPLWILGPSLFTVKASLLSIDFKQIPFLTNNLVFAWSFDLSCLRPDLNSHCKPG